MAHLRVNAHGPLNARLAVIGECPGRIEHETGYPFIGPTGNALNKAISDYVPRVREGDDLHPIRIARSDAFVTNVCNYEVNPATEHEEDRIARWALCIPRLREELDSLTNVRTLLLVGAQAAEAVLGICGPQEDTDPDSKLASRCTPTIQYYHGSTFTRKEALALQEWARGRKIETVGMIPPTVHSVVVSLHPAFAMHADMPRFEIDIRNKLRWAAYLSTRESGPYRPDPATMEIAPPPDRVRRFMSENPSAIIDAETTLDEKLTITYFGMASPDGRVISFPWNSLMLEYFQQWLRIPGEIVGHNLIFDLRALKKNGAPLIRSRHRWHINAMSPPRPHVKTVFDTIVAAGRLEPIDDEVRDFPWLSLAACSLRYNPGFFYWKEYKRECQRALLRTLHPIFQDRSDDGVYEMVYNAIDVNRTAALAQYVREYLRREEML